MTLTTAARPEPASSDPASLEPGRFEERYRAVQSRDARFDGWFFTAVTSTGIYCRPSCPARTPKPENVRFYPTAAAAQAAGFRACRRCRPDATPGSPEWNQRADVVGRAMRAIADGLVDREGVAGLARHLGYSPRQLHRLLVAEVGAGAEALARAARAQTARILIETTDLALADVAFAAGFGSVRQFNDTVQAVFATAPRDLRARSSAAGRGSPVAGHGAGTVAVRLPYRRPMAANALFGFLAARAVPGVEAPGPGDPGGAAGTGGPAGLVRSLRLPQGAGVVELEDDPAAGAVRARLYLEHLGDLGPAVSRCRRLLDLDADPEAVDRVLGSDPALAPLVAARPGLRLPGSADGYEMAVRAVVGQQVSVTAARAMLGRLASTAGPALSIPQGGVSRLFPTPAEVAGTTGLALPAGRLRTLAALAEAMADGLLDLGPGADRAAAAAALQALPGVGPWTAALVALRGLGDPDAFVATDLGVQRALAAAGLDPAPAAAEQRAQRWRPWRGYAVVHLWCAPVPGHQRRGDHAA